MEIWKKLKVHFLKRKLRELQLKQMYPDRYSKHVPEFGEFLLEEIAETKRELVSLGVDLDEIQ